MLIERANPWICLGLATVWLALSVISPPQPGFTPTLSQIIFSQIILHFLLLTATVLTAATVPPSNDDRGVNSFVRTMQVIRTDVFRVTRGFPFPRAVRLGLLAGIAMTAASGVVALLIGMLAESAGNEVELQPIVGIFLRSAWPARIALLVSITILSPIFEELFFRYAMESVLTGTLGSVGRAVAYSAIFFAGMHGNLAAFPSLLLVAAVCSFIYRRSGNLAAPITAHFLFNLVSIAIIICGGAE